MEKWTIVVNCVWNIMYVLNQQPFVETIERLRLTQILRVQTVHSLRGRVNDR